MDTTLVIFSKIVADGSWRPSPGLASGILRPWPALIGKGGRRCLAISPRRNVCTFDVNFQRRMIFLP
jgi:hypothetical protein